MSACRWADALVIITFPSVAHCKMSGDTRGKPPEPRTLHPAFYALYVHDAAALHHLCDVIQLYRRYWLYTLQWCLCLCLGKGGQRAWYADGVTLVLAALASHAAFNHAFRYD